jgi:hypothetical protein
VPRLVDVIGDTDKGKRSLRATKFAIVQSICDQRQKICFSLRKIRLVENGLNSGVKRNF